MCVVHILTNASKDIFLQWSLKQAEINETMIIISLFMLSNLICSHNRIIIQLKKFQTFRSLIA